jgi:Ca2+-binding EF-hand superfamily protein
MEPGEFASLRGINAAFEEVDSDGDGKVFLDEVDRFARLGSYLAQCAVEMEVESIEKPLFGILDTNLDRRLTAREFATGHERMKEFDNDHDELLNEAELDALRRFRVRFAFVVPPAVRPERDTRMNANRRMPVASGQSFTGPSWFQKMDRNQDGDVTWREFLGPKSAFDLLDTDACGWIDRTEAAIDHSH